MISRRREQRLRRRRFFVACEGDSEYGYAALLQSLANESGLAVHLDIREYRGGDPLAVVEKAVKELSLRRIAAVRIMVKPSFWTRTGAMIQPAARCRSTV